MTKDISKIFLDELAKDGGKKKKTQWEILQMCDVPDEEISQFTDAQHWLRYFPPHCMRDLKAFGLHADWRQKLIGNAAPESGVALTVAADL